jgi:chromosome condensin MukBEF MukE localization factor
MTQQKKYPLSPLPMIYLRYIVIKSQFLIFLYLLPEECWSMGVQPKMNIYDVQIYKANNNELLDELNEADIGLQIYSCKQKFNNK